MRDLYARTMPEEKAVQMMCSCAGKAGRLPDAAVEFGLLND